MNILVTGGASGLGEAITRKLASDTGNNVFFSFCHSAKNAGQLEKECSNTTAIPCNFQNPLDIESLLSFIENTQLDTLVNNAFATSISQEYFHKTEIELFARNFQSNIMPVIQITQKAIINFRKQKFGRIINILSSAIINTPPKGWAEYVASKAYLSSLSKTWATENSRFNITSNSISPSFLQTSLNAGIDPRTVEGIIENNPLKKLLTTKEVAEAVHFLANSSQQINGINLIMNAASDVI